MSWPKSFGRTSTKRVEASGGVGYGGGQGAEGLGSGDRRVDLQPSVAGSRGRKLGLSGACRPQAFRTAGRRISFNCEVPDGMDGEVESVL